MIFFMFLGIFQLTPYNTDYLKEISEKTPVFTFFLMKSCPDCLPYFEPWSMIVKKYDNRNDIIISEADCKTYRYLRKLYKISWVPSFVVFYKNQSWFEKFLPSFNALDDAIQKTISIHNNLENKKFREFSLDDAKYPAFVIGGDDVEKEIMVEKYQFEIPQLKENFYITKSNQSKGIVYLNKHKSILFERNPLTDNLDKFIKEFTLLTLGNWKLNEAKNSIRRFAFFIYDKESQISSYQSFACKYESRVLFGKIEANDFRNLYPNIEIDPKKLPLLAVSNKDKTRFTILENQRNYHNVINRVINGKGEFLMRISLQPIFPDIVEPVNLATISYSLFAFAVIFITGVCIWKKADECINIHSHKYYKALNSNTTI